MNHLAKVLIFSGVFFLIFGFIMLLASKQGGGFGRLPGDIVIKKGSASFFFPITTSILVSVILCVVVKIWSSWR